MKSARTAALGLPAAAALLCANAWAASGADQLLKSVQPPKPSGDGNAASVRSVSGPTMFGLADVKLQDAFAVHLFSQWQASDKMPYHVGVWAQKALSGDIRGAAHLWGQVKGSFSPAFAPTGRIAHLYFLWKLNLAQPFVDAWVGRLVANEATEAKAMGALLQAVRPTLSSLLLENSAQLTPQQIEFVVGKLALRNEDGAYDSLVAWALLRDKRASSEAAVKLLERMPSSDPLKLSLSKTVAFAFARKGDLGTTGQVLKRHMEPAIQAKGDATELSSYYLQIARLLFQAEALDAAEEFYRKVPNGRPEFLQAREELAWTMLRKGDSPALRGELKNFKLGLFDDHFLPEILVVSAISNLKLCRYREVEEDFRSFARTQKAWATKIEAQLAKDKPDAPGVRDAFVELAERATGKRADELAALQELRKESIEAALPAVGEQSHWQEAERRQMAAIEDAAKGVNRERRRVWKGRADALREAIRKMKFVKVELLSQLARTNKPMHAKAEPNWEKLKQTALRDQKDSILFPFDGVAWSDELFRLRALSESTCLL